MATPLYRYFANSDALPTALLEEGYSVLGARLAAAAAAEREPLARLEAIGRANIAFGRERQMHYQLMFMRREAPRASVGAQGKRPQAVS